MTSGFVVGYGIVLANLFYLNNNPLSRFHGLKIMEFFYFLDLTEGEVQKFRQNRISPCVLCGGMVVQNGIYATTRLTFSGLSHAAYALATPGFTHTLSAMHAGSLQFRRLTFSGGN